MKYVIGIDCGGTNTVATAYKLDTGDIIGTTTTGYGNLLVDEEKALVHIEEAMDYLLNEFGEFECDAIILGIAGIDSGNYYEIVQDHFSLYQDKLIVMNDAWLAYYATVKNTVGALVIAGTGSILIGKDDQNTYRVGGWGHLFGDEGSAYGIGKTLIQQVTQYYDQQDDYTLLGQQLLKAYEFSTVFELIRYVYSVKKDKIADLAHFVATEAEKENEEAIDILVEAGIQLGVQFKFLYEKMDNKPAVVGLSGSVLLKNKIVLQAFEETVQKINATIQFKYASGDNTKGAYFYHQLKEGKGD